MKIDKRGVIADLESYVLTKLNLLAPVATAWQPSDFVPDLRSEESFAELKNLRSAAAGLPDDVLIVLVGTMVTEEALPSYQTFLNRLDGMRDETGSSGKPWSLWSRGWTAEENRHGDLLNRYLYLSGRVDMRAVETTIHHLIRNGFDPLPCNDPYMGLVYTSFQERATRISHTRVGQLARRSGEPALAKLCNVIAGDEARHEEAYKSFMGRIFEVDPAGAVLAFGEMLKHRIVMPASLMSDNKDDDLFANFSAIAQKIGVYTFPDYIDIMEHLIALWDVPNLKGLTDAAAAAQDRICRLPELYRRKASKVVETQAPPARVQFPWIGQVVKG